MMNEVSSESGKPLSTEKHTTRKIKKTNAQKCKEYRERKKLKIVRMSKNSARKSNVCCEKDQLKITKEPKSDAQRSREYRARCKDQKREMKIRKQIIELNALLTNYHSNVKMGDVQKQNQNGSESRKLDSQSEFQQSKVIFKQRIKEKMDKFEAS